MPAGIGHGRAETLMELLEIYSGIPIANSGILMAQLEEYSGSESLLVFGLGA